MLTRDHLESELLSLEVAKAHLRVDGEDEDPLIQGLVSAAREHAEAITRRALALSTFTLHLDRPRRDIVLPRPPVLAVTRVEYEAPDGELVTLDPGGYQLLPSTPARLILEAVPATSRRPGSFRVTYQAGYDSQTLPKSIAQALLLMVGHWYAHREAVLTGTIATPLPMAVEALLGPHRVAVYG